MASTAKARVGWPDAARGLAITLVVLHHSVLYLLQQNLTDPLWGTLTQVLGSMRMPLFFAVAGLFAGKWARAEWRDLLRTKVLLFAWVFAVWVVIRWVWFNLDPFQTVEDGVGKLIVRFIWPTGGWFIFTLALFFIMLKLTRNTPRWAQVVVAATASILSLSGVINVGNHAWDGVLSFYFFFLVGVHCRTVLLPLVDRIPIAAALVGGPIGLAAIAGAKYLNFDDIMGAEFVLRLMGLVSGLCLARVLAGSRLLRHLGQNTLPIYMLHSLPIASICSILAALSIIPSGVHIILPLSVAGVALCGSYWIGVAAARTRYSAWLFAVPAWVRTRGKQNAGHCGKLPAPIHQPGSPQ